MHSPIRIDPETGHKLFNTRAAKASDKITGKGYSAIDDEALKTLPSASGSRFQRGRAGPLPGV